MEKKTKTKKPGLALWERMRGLEKESERVVGSRSVGLAGMVGCRGERCLFGAELFFCFSLPAAAGAQDACRATLCSQTLLSAAEVTVILLGTVQHTKIHIHTIDVHTYRLASRTNSS